MSRYNNEYLDVDEYLVTEEHHGTFSLPTPPPVVGYWIVHTGGPFETRFTMYRKPQWLTRFLMKHCFEIEWKDHAS